MGRKKIETVIKEKIAPFELNQKGKSDVDQLTSQYPYDFLLECIDIGVSKYYRYDKDGNVTQESVNSFLNKLGGIAYNRSRSPIEQEIIHIKNICKSNFAYWDKARAEDIIYRYVTALRRNGFTDEMIKKDLQTEVKRVSVVSKNWSQWSSVLEQWIDDINHWDDADYITIEQNQTILPNSLFDELPKNLQSLCKQINASYENNLYDCTAVIMRRLLEGLLVISYQHNDIEEEICDSNGNHFSLDKIIKNAEQNKTLKLSSNTKKNMKLFKDLGNYSAHKIWFNSTRQDIEPHILEYRAIIEELLYKTGLVK